MRPIPTERVRLAQRAAERLAYDADFRSVVADTVRTIREYEEYYCHYYSTEDARIATLAAATVMQMLTEQANDRNSR